MFASKELLQYSTKLNCKSSEMLVYWDKMQYSLVPDRRQGGKFFYTAKKQYNQTLQLFSGRVNLFLNITSIEAQSFALRVL